MHTGLLFIQYAPKGRQWTEGLSQAIRCNVYNSVGEAQKNPGKWAPKVQTPPTDHRTRSSPI
eukprot:1157349-Pelagomonas_calceolata.AAC.19